MIVRWLFAISFFLMYFGMVHEAFDVAFHFRLTWFGWATYGVLVVVGLFYAILYGSGMYEKRKKKKNDRFIFYE